MPELLKTTCKQGQLILTDTAIIVELKGFGRTFKSETLLRSAFSDVDMKSLTGANYNLIFHGQDGKALKADWVNHTDACRIVALLTGRE